MYVFGEMSVWFFGSFFDWVVYFSGIELHELRKKMICILLCHLNHYLSNYQCSDKLLISSPFNFSHFTNRYGLFVLGFPGGSDGKEFACNVGDSGLREWLPIPALLDFPSGSDGEEYTRNMEDLGLISELGRSPGGGHGNLLQNSGLENPHGQRSLAGGSP